MIFWEKPDEGYIRGRRFAHPKLKFTFEVPSGFRLYNQSQAVVARDSEGTAAIQFDRAPKPYGGSMTDYLTEVWGAQVRLTNIEAMTVNGLAGENAAVPNAGQDCLLGGDHHQAHTSIPPHLLSS